MYRLDDKRIIFEGKNVDLSFLPLLGFGSQADVYKIRLDNKLYALKIFNDISNVKESDCESKMNIDLDSYVTPKKLLYFDKDFKGYITKFYNGPDLSQKRLKNVTIDEFYKSSIKLNEDTKKLSELGFTIYNSFISNTLYDEGFKMLATDNYKLNENDNLEDIKKINNRRVNQLLYDVFINATGLAKIFHEDVDMTKLKAACNSGKISFDELLDKICNRAYNISDEEITKMGEVGRVLRKVHK